MFLSLMAWMVIVTAFSELEAGTNATFLASGNQVHKENASFFLSKDKDLISVDAEDVPIDAILNRLSELTGIEIASCPLPEKISVSFQNLTLENALKRLVKDHAIIFKKNNRVENQFKIIKVHIPHAQSHSRETESDNTNDVLTSSRLRSTDKYQAVFNTARERSEKRIKADSDRPQKEGLSGAPRHVEGQIVLKLKQNLTDHEIGAIVNSLGMTLRKSIPELNYYVFSLFSGVSVNDALKHLSNMAAIEKAEPNYLIPINMHPNDPYYNKQWALHDTDINAPEAWDIEIGKREIIVAVVDTGVDYEHEDLSPNIWINIDEIPNNGLDDDGNGFIDDVRGWDFVDALSGAASEDYNFPDNDPADRHGHGTHVAGIIAAVGNNEKGIAGVAWNCQIMAVRAGYKTASGGGVLESFDAAQAILYAVNNGAKILNLSWGDYQKSHLIEEALAVAAESGVLICAAAGNDNSQALVYPAALENSSIIAVGATDNEDKRASFSNHGEWVDVSAPGVNIFSTYPNNNYLTMNGTSMATPLVSVRLHYFFHISMT
jgi:subtilisin family serine protease